MLTDSRMLVTDDSKTALPMRATRGLGTCLVAIVLYWLVLYAVRLWTPDDILNRDQQRPLAYIVDALVNGNWLCQFDFKGDITSKPPLYTWLAALSAMVFGLGRLSATFPAAVATLLSAIVISIFAYREISPRVGVIAGIIYLSSLSAIKQIALIRTDGLFTFTVLIMALCAFYSWRSGRRWWLMWLCGSLSVLAKGPLGLVFGLSGLCASFMPSSRLGSPWLKLSFWWGLVFVLLIAGGWYFEAWLAHGDLLVNKMLYQEHLGHLLTEYGRPKFGSALYKPPLYLFSRFLPWSIAGLLVCLRPWRRGGAEEYKLETWRFLVCWIGVGVIVLAVAAHKRGDLVFPLIPPLAILSAAGIARWTEKWETRQLKMALLGVMAATIAFSSIYHGYVRGSRDFAVRALQYRKFAEILRQEAGEGFPFSFYRTKYPIQFELNIMRELAAGREVHNLLNSGDAVYVVTDEPLRLLKKMQGSATTPVFVLSSADGGMGVVSNREAYTRAGPLALVRGRIMMRLIGVEAVSMQGNCPVLRTLDKDAKVVFLNKRERPAAVCLEDIERKQRFQAKLGAWQEMEFVMKDSLWRYVSTNEGSG